MKPITVIIPTWNFEKFLLPLYESIVNTDFKDLVEEVIFVCEKSEDDSEALIQKIIRDEAKVGRKVRLIVPEKRRGLFFARYEGAAAAKTEKVMYIDSRIVLPKATGQALCELVPKFSAMSSIVDIDITKNIFCLYWQRSHETIFYRTYREHKNVFEVNHNNFDLYRIGGTCFFCNRELFLKVSSKYLTSGLKSDDTYVMKEMVQTEPFFVHPDFRIQWEPRDEWKSFITHLYYRGPGFAEYHLFENRSWLFYAVLVGAMGLLLTTALVLFKPLWAFTFLATGLGAISASTFVLAKGPVEGIKLLPLHVAVVLAYGFGALRGAWVIYKKRKSLPLITQKI